MTDAPPPPDPNSPEEIARKKRMIAERLAAHRKERLEREARRPVIQDRQVFDMGFETTVNLSTLDCPHCGEPARLIAHKAGPRAQPAHAACPSCGRPIRIELVHEPLARPSTK